MNRLLLSFAICLAACDAPTSPNRATAQPQVPVAEVQAHEKVGKSTGIEVLGPHGLEWKDGDAIGAGTTVRTDHGTRAQLKFGPHVVSIAHGTEVTFDSKTSLTLKQGRIIVESGDQALTVSTPSGPLVFHAAKASVRIRPQGVQMTVSKGSVEAQGASNVLAYPGTELSWELGGAPVTRWSNALGSELAWSAELVENSTTTDKIAAGLGKLVGKQPNGERERPLDLAFHRVNVDVKGNVAVTEIHEGFRNATGETLEGLYRFPMPSDAQISGMSLKVGDRWMDGEFLETARAERIFRDVIDRWMDPALLKWKQGNQFELRIFPITPGQIREVKISYVQTLPRAGSEYRYTYPMPVDVRGQIPAKEFSFEARLFGVDTTAPVNVDGYDAKIERGATQSDVPFAKVRYKEGDFWAAGNLAIRFSRPNDHGVNVYTFDERIRTGEPSYALVTAVLDLADAPSAATRDYVIVADTSYSRRGLVAKKQTELIGRMILEMDPSDRVAVMACSTTCRPVMSGRLEGTNADLATGVMQDLLSVQPAGTFDPVEAARVAERIFNARSSEDQAREQHLIMATDGAVSAGAANPDTLRKAFNELLGPRHIRTSLIDLGGDRDEANLSAIATAIGASVVALDPGQTMAQSALDVLRRHYGTPVTDVVVEWPSGVTESTLPSATTLNPGDELMVAARFYERIDGDLVIHGVRLDKPFTQRIPISLVKSTSSANSFVPRKWASLTMSALDMQGETARPELIRMSIRYGVLSRYTALLALEDRQMMSDYGVRETAREELVASSDEDSSDGKAPTDAPESRADVLGGAARKTSARHQDEPSGAGAPLSDSFGEVEGLGRAEKKDARRRSRPVRAKGRVRPVSKSSKSGDEIVLLDDFAGIQGAGGWARQPRHRAVPTLWVSDARPPSSAERRLLDRRSQAWRAEPDNRTKRMAFIRALIANGRIAQAHEETTRWLDLNPMDAEAVVQMAQVVQFDMSADPLTWLESGADAQPRGKWVHERLAWAYEASGYDALACAQRVLLADLEGKSSVDILSCPIATNLEQFGLAKDRLTPEVRTRQAVPRGQIVVKWSGDPDVDVLLVEPDGRVLSWLSQRRHVKVSGRRTSEFAMSLPTARNSGSYSVVVVAPRRAHGTLTVEGLRSRKTFEVTANSSPQEIAELSFQTPPLSDVTKTGRTR